MRMIVTLIFIIDLFQVALNGIHFCEFPHRIPFQRISHFTVDGDVMISMVAFEGAQPPQQVYMVRINCGTNCRTVVQ
jgi:hypothetical protein